MLKPKTISDAEHKKIIWALNHIFGYFHLSYAKFSRKYNMRSRKEELVKAKRLCYYLFKRYTTFSNNEIAHYFNVSHATVIYHHNEIKDKKIGIDEELTNTITQLTPMIMSLFTENDIILNHNVIALDVTALSSNALIKIKRLLHKINEDCGFTNYEIDRAISKVDRQLTL